MFLRGNTSFFGEFGESRNQECLYRLVVRIKVRYGYTNLPKCFQSLHEQSGADFRGLSRRTDAPVKDLHVVPRGVATPRILFRVGWGLHSLGVCVWRQWVCKMRAKT